MKVFLLHPDRDFDLEAAPPWNEAALIQDLELDTLLDAMAQGDAFLRTVAQRALLASLIDPAAIRYRQAVLRDCLESRGIVRAIYRTAVEAIEGEAKQYLGVFSHHPEAILQRAVTVVQLLLQALEAIRHIADVHAGCFASEGWRRLFSMLDAELDDEYLALVRAHLRELRFGHGVLASARLGKGHVGVDLVLRKPSAPPESWLTRLLGQGRPGFSYHLHPRDESGARALSDLKQRALNPAANALARSADHILGFLTVLRTELAFYLGCVNLEEQLARIGMPTCVPEPLPLEGRAMAARGLYDACLALSTESRVVGNDLHAQGKSLVIVTGANQGGKSTFLRSVGLAQLMMQCGLFVPAEAFRANVCAGVVTHYKREEDRGMRSGKLDEELARMSAIADRLTPNALILFNESFAATNEREGSEIARQIVLALREAGMKQCFVTHLYDFAHSLCEFGLDDALFLRAQRQADGRRTFQIAAGEPQRTSHGADLYRRIFGVEAGQSPRAEASEHHLSAAA